MRETDSSAQTWYFSLFFYCVSLGLSKTSICVIYVTIFTYDWAKKCSWAMLIFVVVHNLWALGTTLTFCIPLQSVWDPRVKASYCHSESIWWVNTRYEHPHHSPSPQRVVWKLTACSSLGVFTDFLIFLLPIPMIMPLKLPRRQKIAVTVVFAIGFL